MTCGRPRSAVPVFGPVDPAEDLDLGFELDPERLPDPALGGRETAIVGVSYSLNKRLTTRLALGTERSTDKPLPALRKGDSVSVDAGASLSLSRRIALTGGVRYNIERDRMLQDDRRDSQAVYVGTAFKF